MNARINHIDLKFRIVTRITAMAVVLLCVGATGCHSSGNHVSRSALIKGVQRALTEPETLTYGTYVQHGNDLVVKAYCSGRRDGSHEMKVFDKDDRLIYELTTRSDEAQDAMHLVERNRVSGKTLEYDVPCEQYYDLNYDPRMLGSDDTAPFWGCLLGDDWRSWIAPRNDFRTFLAEQIQEGRLRVVNRGGQELILVEQPRLGFPLAHEFYFDPQDHLLRLWRTVHEKDQRLTRGRVYVCCDHMSQDQCVNTLNSTFSRLVKSEGEVR